MQETYPALMLKACKVCGKEKFAGFYFTRNRNVCKECENMKNLAIRHATGSDPKMKWRSYGRRP